ncbi:Uncharacterized protein C18orf63 [Araneus ventricosus]|uniref:Uncharacterized protein C18orf63 n=1 Tax=Araneus ventricosus TaxID=182803 RepID=A0A4Y2CCJ5_ARAVE|nr:Uncharacterized protein C18orf63 [Araneus ventricosus]
MYACPFECLILSLANVNFKGKCYYLNWDDIHPDNECSQRSLFHAKVLKCRELILAEGNVVSCPSKDAILPIKAVIPKAKIHCPEFRGNLEKMSLEIVAVEETTTAILQECLQYTCTAKLAPSWNIVENILVQGPDFLISVSPLNAVKMDIFVSHREISLCLQPTCIKLPMMKIERYIKSEQFMSSSCKRLKENCHVLPSMKQGIVTAVSNSPQTTGFFKNYSEIQKHWKDMYGYLLPNIPEECIKYFNVIFRIPNATPYTYPQFCVRPCRMTTVPRVDPKTTLCFFIKDFCKKVGNVCGERCRLIEGRASFTSLELHPSVKITEDMKPRAGTTYAMKTNAPYRQDLPIVSTPFNKAQGFYQNASDNTDTFNRSVQSQTFVTPQEFPNSSHDKNIKHSETNLDCSSFSETNENKSENVLKKILMHSNTLQSSAEDLSEKKYAPHFVPIRPKSRILFAKPSNQTSRFAPKFCPLKSDVNSVKLPAKTVTSNSEMKEKNSVKTKQLTKCDESTQKGIETGKTSKTSGKKKLKQTELNFELNFNIKKKRSVEKDANEAVNDLNKKSNEDSEKNKKKKKRS